MSDAQMSRDQIEDKMLRDARATLAHHVVAHAGEGRWTVRRPGYGSIDSAEVVALSANASLLVHGDHDPCIFAWHRKAELCDPVFWVADASVDYAREKAASGMGSPDIVVKWDGDLAAREFEALVAEDFVAETGERGDYIAYFADLAAHSARSQDRQGFLGNAQECIDEDGEATRDMGEVTAWRVIWAKAVAEKVAAWLRAQEPSGEAKEE
jgi:hypothetical protein